MLVVKDNTSGLDQLVHLSSSSASALTGDPPELLAKR